MPDDPIRTKVPVPVEHVLALVPIGSEVPGMVDVTPSKLKEMGYRHHSEAYKRYRHLFERAGFDIDRLRDPADDGVNMIRYILCEYLTQYDHDPDDDDFERLKVALKGANLALQLYAEDPTIDLDRLMFKKV
jgi:hypothetical protein